jgi:hypothetical protein
MLVRIVYKAYTSTRPKKEGESTMNLRTALLAIALALAATALRAEELQVTVHGVASCVIESCNPQTTFTGPFIVSYDVNTLSGIQTPTFLQNELLVFNAASLSITHFSVIVDGHTIAFAPHTTGAFRFLAESAGTYQFTGGAGPEPGGSFAFEAAVSPVLTEAQFMALKDPLADMLLLYRSPPGSPCGVNCELFPSHLTLNGTLTVTRVPTPVPLSLSLAGLVGLALSRRRRFGAGCLSTPSDQRRVSQIATAMMTAPTRIAAGTDIDLSPHTASQTASPPTMSHRATLKSQRMSWPT